MYTRQTFLGASIESFSSSIGWGQNGSTFSCVLYEDPSNGDSFQTYEPGVPLYFSFYGFTYSGILQKPTKSNSRDGLPAYSVILSDPKEILSCVEIIISSYNNTVRSVPNLYNVYSFWENGVGFGESDSTDAGMPWVKIKDALLSICNSPSYTDYGGPITFKGYTYGLDLSELPSPPRYYRFNNTSINLLDAITQLCDDAGFDFFVELIGLTIKIRTVSRNSQPSGTDVARIVGNNYGNVVSSEIGKELRNEVTSSFLVGGHKTTLFQTNEIRNFWGYDFSGNPILGNNISFNLTDEAGVAVAAINTEEMYLNAESISYILGTVSYYCTTFEMRCAKDSYDTWAAFIEHNRPSLATSIGLISWFKNNQLSKNPVKADVINDEPAIVNLMNSAVENDNFAKSFAVYEFVRAYADNYMGKKFVVKLPFIQRKQDSETLKVTYSYEISSEGGYLEEGSNPLGLSTFYEDIFRNPDGRFRAFVRYDTIVAAELSEFSIDGSIIDSGKLFSEVQVDPNLIFTSSDPYALITLQTPLAEKAIDNTGNIDVVAGIIKMNRDKAKHLIRNNYIPLSVAPKTISPNLAAIPLKSNIEVYGPWAAIGAPGKVRFEQDQSLTPWDYGDEATMNLAGQSRVNSSISFMTFAETGRIELEGPPTTTIGYSLIANGPLCTNINVRIGDKITTEYIFETYTPRFGAFSRTNQERFRRLAITNQSVRRAIRVISRQNARKNSILKAAATTAKAFWANAPKTVKKNSPHDTIVSYNFLDENLQRVRNVTQSCTLEEALTLTNSDNSGYTGVGISSMSGLFRPFSTNISPIESSVVPNFESGTITQIAPCRTTLNPYKEKSDVEILGWGSSYEGVNAYRRTADYSDIRGVCLKSPLVLSGWGYGLYSTSITPTGNYLLDSKNSKTGPVDLLWDEHRAVWTSNTSLYGVTERQISARSSGNIVLYSLNSGIFSTGITPKKQLVYNYSNTGISGNIPVVTNYIANINTHVIVSADCHTV